MEDIKPSLFGPLCDICGKNTALHYYALETDNFWNRCCDCHIASGGSPADGHDDCIEAVKRRRK